MGRLPEAVEGSEPDRPKELVVPRVLHDQLSNCCFTPAATWNGIGTEARLSISIHRDSRHLHLREAAIHEQFRSRDIAAVVGGEKYDSLRNLV